MGYRDQVNQAVQSVGSQLGARLALDAGGAVSLGYADGQTCHLFTLEAEQRVLLVAPVAEVRADSKRVLFEAALRINHDAPRTDAGTLGYDADQRALVLTASLAGTIDADRLAGALARFLRSAIACRERLTEVLQSSRATPTAAAATDDDYRNFFVKI